VGVLGAAPIWTPFIFAELARAGRRLPFFVEAPRALAQPGLIRAMQEAGHEVGFHCVQHLSHAEMSEAALAAEAAAGLEIPD
jgi:peptidoglycan/xylan/chitin deacetylase (PgdA/CDA1 family)